MPAMDPSREISELLEMVNRGDAHAQARLIGLMYADLHARAANYMRGERRGHTLQPTALVNETYLRLFQHQNVDFRNRAHFLAIASSTMRRVLVDHARAKSAAKREGDKAKIELEDFHAAAIADLDQMLILDQALTRLAEMDADLAALVELMYFGGLTQEEAAAALDVSSRTIKRNWSSARAWLQAELKRPHP